MVKNVLCLVCHRELNMFNNHPVCYVCEQAYYFDEDGNLDYYANLGEFIPLTRKQQVLADFKERYTK